MKHFSGRAIFLSSVSRSNFFVEVYVSICTLRSIVYLSYSSEFVEWSSITLISNFAHEDEIALSAEYQAINSAYTFSKSVFIVGPYFFANLPDCRHAAIMPRAISTMEYFFFTCKFFLPKSSSAHSNDVVQIRSIFIRRSSPATTRLLLSAVLEGGYNVLSL